MNRSWCALIAPGALLLSSFTAAGYEDFMKQISMCRVHFSLTDRAVRGGDARGTAPLKMEACGEFFRSWGSGTGW